MVARCPALDRLPLLGDYDRWSVPTRLSWLATTEGASARASLAQKWVRFLWQLGGLAKVDLGFVYAANFSSSACVA